MKKRWILLPFLLAFFFCTAQKKGKGKEKDKDKDNTNYKTPAPDTANSFTGIIRYHITNDDPADKDSMNIIFGKNQIRVTLFYPSKKKDEIIEENRIADFNNNTILLLNITDSTYKVDSLNKTNQGGVFTLEDDKKTGLILKNTCKEYAGTLKTKDGSEFEAACLVGQPFSYAGVENYNFLNIHPMVMGYKIVLGFRTKSSDNENTYIMAYKIEPGNTDRYFDLGRFRVKGQ